MKLLKMEMMKEITEIRKELESKASKVEIQVMKDSIKNEEKDKEPAWGELVSKVVDEKFIYLTEDICKVQQNVQETKNKMKESEDKIKESEDKQRRRSNVIVYNVEESTAEDGKERSEEDKGFCQDLMTEVLKVGYEEGDITKVIRLGKKEGGKRRPLLVNFKSDKEKNLVMENAGKLGKAKDKFQGVTMSHDMTLNERLQCKEMVEEARNKQANDTSGDWLYKVRGLPGLMQVVKMKKY